MNETTYELAEIEFTGTTELPDNTTFEAIKHVTEDDTTWEIAVRVYSDSNEADGWIQVNVATIIGDILGFSIQIDSEGYHATKADSEIEIISGSKTLDDPSTAGAIAYLNDEAIAAHLNKISTTVNGSHVAIYTAVRNALHAIHRIII
jgi:hypothetical protein